MNERKITINTTDEYEKFIIKEMEKLKKNNPDVLVYEVDISNYHNILSLDLFKDLRSVDAIKKDILNYLEEHYSSGDEAFIKIIIDNIMKKFKPDIKIIEEDYLSWEYDDFINQLISDYVVYEYDLDEILENTDLFLNLFSYQYGNINTGGKTLQRAIDALIKLYSDEGYDPYYKFKDNEELKKFLSRDIFLEKLFKSQGYEFKDLGDKEKVDNSIFLTSFLSEIKNNDFTGYTFFTFLVKMNGKDYLYNLRDTNKVLVLKPNDFLKCGLFDPYNNSSSLLEVVLEKPFEISIDFFNLQIQVEDRDKSLNLGDYTPKYELILLPENWYEDFYFKFNEDKLKSKYEAFKLEWILDSGYTMKDFINVLDEIYKDKIENSDTECSPSEILNEFESDYGFDWDIYPSYKEWFDNEFLEENYQNDYERLKY